ncbi:unnamed protein product [Staurois parvus]|uniref:Uncharacterized protein n=1 Tax=Staurois parvus TaxID=386267 RepID=A0ABN9F2U6_9NEOB|nr:unnamed protein product [Staurois parvus]
MLFILTQSLWYLFSVFCKKLVDPAVLYPPVCPCR